MTALAVLVLVLGAVAPCLMSTMRGGRLDRLVGLEVLGVACTLTLLLLGQAVGRTVYVDVALLLALLSFAGALVFARFFGRSL